MDVSRARNACHFFTACRADRPPERYRIDFALREILDAVPAFRHGCGRDVFDVPREESPIELRWLVYRKIAGTAVPPTACP